MKEEFSAGGVVYRRKTTSRQTRLTLNSTQNPTQELFILVAQHSQHHGWVFPKGLIDEEEAKEETAVREVEEETGVQATIKKPLEPVTYWYQFQDEKRKKTVYYFLMEYRGEDTSKKDDEMENVEWIGAEDVEQKLTYPSDKKVWQQAQKLISNF